MKTSIALAVLAFAAVSSVAGAQSSKPTFRHKIAINQGKWDEIRFGQWSLPAVERNGLQAMIIEKLQKTGQFVVMERELSAKRQMDEEREIKEAAGVQKPQARLAARYVLTPEVTSFEFKSSKKQGFNIGGLKLGENKSRVQFSLSIRIVDAETSQTLDVATGTAEQETKDSSFDPSALLPRGLGYEEKSSSSKSYGKVFQEAIGKAVDEVCARIAAQRWSARVVQVADTGRLAINAGSTSGVEIGQTFVVYKTSGRIVDDSGEILSEGDETAIGRVKVVRVENGVAFCEVLSGKGFTSKNLVRPE